MNWATAKEDKRIFSYIRVLFSMHIMKQSWKWWNDIMVSGERGEFVKQG